MIKDNLPNGILLTNISYYTASMEKKKLRNSFFWRLLQSVTECALMLCHKITATKLWALSYGVAGIVIISKRKAAKNT